MTDLLYGDCMLMMDDIVGKSVDMVLCDLPYGATKNEWDRCLDLDMLWSHYKRIVKDDGAIVLFASGMFTSVLMMSNKKDWRYNLVWHKTTPTGFLNAKKMPLRAHEDICVFYRKLPVYNPQKTQAIRKISTSRHKRNSKKGSNYGDYGAVSYDSDERYPTSVLTFKTDKQRETLHPTQKPVALCEYLIRTYTKPGDIVLDNCMGSGTTGVAAVNCGRGFVGIESNQDFFTIAKKRIDLLSAQMRFEVFDD